MNLGRIIEDYFQRLDAGEADAAISMFEADGRIDAPWETGMAPSAFVKGHLESAPVRAHDIVDVLISDTGQAAAVHFEYRSRDKDGQERPTFVGCDHFKFGPDGKIAVLSVYCHAKQSNA